MAGNRLIVLVALMAATITEVSAQDNLGLWAEVNVERKVSKRLEIGGGIEVRRRDFFRDPDRISVGVDAGYKLTDWLKLSAGVSLLEDNRHKLNNTGRKYADYWATRYRVYVGLTGSLSLGDLTISLRERWQYSYRPEDTVARYWNYEDDEEDRYLNEFADMHTFNGKGKNVWRNRLQLKYKLSKMWRPYVNVETNVSHGLEKMRYAAGSEIRLNKQHSLDLKYLFQSTPNDDDEEGNRHVIGIGYTYKF